MKRIGFNFILLIFIMSSTLFSIELIEPDSVRIPDVILMGENVYITYPFDINVGRQNPFASDSDYIFYSNRIGGIITNIDGIVAAEDNSYDGLVISRLLYGRAFDSNIFGAYLIRNYMRNISGKTGVTSFYEDSLNNYIIYQNIQWRNEKFPLILSFVSKYNEDSFKYKVKLSGYNSRQFLNLEYDGNDIVLRFSNRIKRFKFEGNLNTGEKKSKFGIFTHIDKSIFNMSEVGIFYDYYNRVFSTDISHLVRLDSKNLLKFGADYRFTRDAYTYLTYFRTKPYINTSFYYYFPSDSLVISATSMFSRKYYKGYVSGSLKYDTTISYNLTLYSTIVWEPKDALFLDPGMKMTGNEKKIEVIPVVEIRFIDASLFVCYNLYWKRISIVGKWDFYN